MKLMIFLRVNEVYENVPLSKSQQCKGMHNFLSLQIYSLFFSLNLYFFSKKSFFFRFFTTFTVNVFFFFHLANVKSWFSDSF